VIHPPQGEVWYTFDPKNRADTLADGLGALELLNEERLPPTSTVPHQPAHNAEILTYVREGALAHEDSRGSLRRSSCR
jgi:redox-sensitive bicupin YhaK (pirin superfamily)